MKKIIWDESYTERTNSYSPQFPEWKKDGWIVGLSILSIIRTNKDREGYRYKFRMPWESIDADYTFTGTEQEAMEKSEALLNKHFEQMFDMEPTSNQTNTKF